MGEFFSSHSMKATCFGGMYWRCARRKALFCRTCKKASNACTVDDCAAEPPVNLCRTLTPAWVVIMNREALNFCNNWPSESLLWLTFVQKSAGSGKFALGVAAKKVAEAVIEYVRTKVLVCLQWDAIHRQGEPCKADQNSKVSLAS